VTDVNIVILINKLSNNNNYKCNNEVRPCERHKDVYRVFLCSVFRFLARSQNCEKRLLTSSCPSVRPHGTTLLPLDGLPWNFIFEYFSKIHVENEVSLKFDKNDGCPARRPKFIYDVSLSYSWNEHCFRQKLKTESKLTFYVPVNEIMRKNMVERGRPQWEIW
jgi:hypothetical protein